MVHITLPNSSVVFDVICLVPFQVLYLTIKFPFLLNLVVVAFGKLVGNLLGKVVGESVGMSVGFDDGDMVGDGVGSRVGKLVGRGDTVGG